MNFKNILALFGVVLFGAGLVTAISGATVGTEVEVARWTGLTAGSVGTEGGNISGVNVTGATLTDRWAAYFGDVTGNIRLTDSAGTNNVYAWTWTAANGGEVCLSTDASFAFASAVAADGTDIDTAMAWGASADDGVTTYTGDDGSITFNGVTAITTADKVVLDGSSFTDVVVSDGADLAYCTNINSAGTNYNGAAANYEIMVPTALTGVTTYNFFAELN